MQNWLLNKRRQVSDPAAWSCKGTGGIKTTFQDKLRSREQEGIIFTLYLQTNWQLNCWQGFFPIKLMLIFNLGRSRFSAPSQKSNSSLHWQMLSCFRLQHVVIKLRTGAARYAYSWPNLDEYNIYIYPDRTNPKRQYQRSLSLNYIYWWPQKLRNVWSGNLQGL